MKLAELYEANQTKPVFAWLEPSQGPENIRGVRLAYIQPLEAEMDDIIAKAQEQADHGDTRSAERAERLRRDKEEYIKRGQRFFTPQLGWWMNEEDFEAGRGGFGGTTKGLLLKKYPNLRVVSSKQEAIEQAKKSGLI